MPGDSFKRMDSSGSNSKNSASDDIFGTSPGTSGLRERTDSEGSDNSMKTFFVLKGTASSPPKVLSVDEVSKVVNNIQKMEIVHEIALNPEFKLRPFEPPENSLEKRVKETMHKVFWDILREQLNRNPPCFDQAIQLLRDIKECFPEIIPKHNQKIIQEINEVLDTTLIKQQAEQGVLDFRAYANFIIQVMAKSCAPVRDECVNNLKKIEDVVETFKGILETMQLMKIDVTNWLLDYLKKDILANSAEYEKEKFKEYLEYYRYGFPLTENWLLRNVKFNSNGTKCSAEEIIFNAYLELLDWNNFEEFPEILLNDKERLLKISNRALRLCLCASTIAICSALPIISQNSENRAALAKQVEIIFQNLTDSEKIQDTLESVWIQVKSFTTNKYNEKGVILEKGIEETLKEQILQLKNKDSRIRKLLWERFIVFISLILLKKLVKPGTPPGYTDFKEELESIANAFRIVTNYNYSVFGEYYIKILNRDENNKNNSSQICANEKESEKN